MSDNPFSPSLGGSLAPQLGGSNYYLLVNHHEGGDEFEILPNGYATEAQARLALIDWLNEHHQEKWTLSGNGEQFIFYKHKGLLIAGEVISKAHAEELRAWDKEYQGDEHKQLFKRDSSRLNHEPPNWE